MRSPSATLLGVALFASLVPSALAPAPSAADEVAVDSFLPAPDQSGFVGFASTRTPGAWGVDTTLWLDYGLRSYELRESVPVRHRLDATVIAQLGVLSRGALALRMPVLLVQRGDELAGRQLDSAGAGNPAVDGRVRLYGAGVRPDGSVQDGAALALRGVLHLPVGSDERAFADDAWRAELAAIWDIELFGIGAGISFAYRHRFDQDEPADGPYAHNLRLSAGVRLPLPLLGRAFPGRVQESVLLEADVGSPARDLFAKRKTPVEGRLGYRVIVGDLFGTLALSAGLTEALSNADLRVIFGLGWSPRQHDSDADGVIDRADQCVHLPEDRDGFEDGDGCADDDDDGDLIVDEDDRCPREAAEPDRDDDEDGCTDS